MVVNRTSYARMNSGWTKARLFRPGETPIRAARDRADGAGTALFRRSDSAQLAQLTTKQASCPRRGSSDRWLRRVCFPRIQATAGYGGLPRFDDPPTAQNIIHQPCEPSDLDAEHRADQRQQSVHLLLLGVSDMLAFPCVQIHGFHLLHTSKPGNIFAVDF